MSSDYFTGQNACPLSSVRDFIQSTTQLTNGVRKDKNKETQKRDVIKLKLTRAIDCLEKGNRAEQMKMNGNLNIGRVINMRGELQDLGYLRSGM